MYQIWLKFARWFGKKVENVRKTLLLAFTDGQADAGKFHEKNSLELKIYEKTNAHYSEKIVLKNNDRFIIKENLTETYTKSFIKFIIFLCKINT